MSGQPVPLAALAVVTGPYLHAQNWRFLWNPNIADTLKGADVQPTWGQMLGGGWNNDPAETQP